MLHRLGRLDEAIDVFSEILESVRKDRLVYESRGLVFQDKKEHRRALRDFTRAIALDDDVGENYYHRGESRLRLLEYSEALEDFASAMARKYCDPCVFNARGMAKFFCGDIDGAITDMSSAIQEEPGNIDFYYNRSRCFLQDDDPGAAEKDMTDALAVAPRNARMYQRRAEARYVQHKFDDAIEDLNVALKFRPDKEMIIWIHRLKGWALANSGRYEEAVECFDKTIAAAKQLELLNGDADETSAAGLDVSGIGTGVNLSPDINHEENDFHERAKALQMCSEAEAALDDFTAVISINPRNAHAFFRRAFAHKALVRDADD